MPELVTDRNPRPVSGDVSTHAVYQKPAVMTTNFESEETKSHLRYLVLEALGTAQPSLHIPVLFYAILEVLVQMSEKVFCCRAGHIRNAHFICGLLLLLMSAD